MKYTMYIAGMLQVKAYRVLQERVSKDIASLGLNFSQWYILSRLMENPELKGADLAAELRVEAPLISRMVDELQARKLIATKPHPTDGRAKLLKLTTKGHKLVRQGEATLKTSVKSMLKGIAPQEMRVYEKVLKAIIENGS